MPERAPVAWRLLRRMLPAWYVRRYGDDLWHTHHAAATGRRQRAGFWLRLMSDVVLTSIQLRLDALSAHAPLHPQTGRHEHGHRYRIDIMREQIGYTLRSLRRAPGFVFTVVVTLGLGIGTTVTLFTILDRLFLSPPEHVVNAREVHRIHVYGRDVFTQEVQHSDALTYPDYADLEQVAGFESVAGYASMELAADASDGPARVRAELAGASYFGLLGVQPHAGRFFAATEDRIEGGEAVAVLGFGYWQRAFGGADDAIGRQIRLGKGTYTVIGIAPRGFTGVDIAPVDVWLPLLTGSAIQNGTAWRDARRWWWLGAVARLDPARSAAAATEATAVYRAGRADVRGQDPDARIVLSPLIAARGPLASRESEVARLLGGLALLVLLIACANVANLMLARGVQRRRLHAIQTAIGATRGRMIGQILAESLLLALAAGGVALGFTLLTAPVLFRVLMPDAAMATSGMLRLLAFTTLVALAVTALIGLVPALRTTRIDVLEALRSARESRRGSRLRRGLLFIQAALSAILVIGAGMFVRSLSAARSLDMGVDTRAIAVQFELQDGTRWGSALNAVAYDAVERLRALPFVSHAAVTQLPHFRGNNGITVLVNGDTISRPARGPFYYSATGGYFDALGLQIVRGRALVDDDDRAGAAPVAVVSESFVRAAFPDRTAIGECVLVAPGGDQLPPCTRIVGVVEDVLPSIRAEEANLNIYLPPHHPGIGSVAASVVVLRTIGPAAPVLGAIGEAASAASPQVRLVEVNALSGFLEYELRPWRLGAALLTAFGVLALLVAAAGLYSVLAFDVAQRRFELGVRAALGADARRLVRTVAARALLVSAAGVIAGAAVAMLIARLADSLLFRVSPLEPRVYLVAFTALMSVAVAAAALPAWRAVRVDPKVALTGE